MWAISDQRDWCSEFQISLEKRVKMLKWKENGKSGKK